jgi:hypothetical protein
MPKLSDLAGALDVSAGDIDFSNLPDQFGIRTPIPQPGAGYVFRFPTITQNDDNWLADLQNGDSQPRIGYAFNEGKELTILQVPGGQDGVGNPVRWRLTNIERKFDEEKSAASAMAHLFKHAFGLDLTGEKNVAYAKALLAVSGRAFGGTVNWTGYCNKERDIYRPEQEEEKDAAGNIIQAAHEGGVVEGHKGCGQRYALKQRTNKKTGEVTLAVPKDDQGRYLPYFLCASENCPAQISMFVELQNFVECPPEFKKLKGAAPEAPVKVEGGNGAEAHAAPAPAAPAKPAQTVSAKAAAKQA